MEAEKTRKLSKMDSLLIIGNGVHIEIYSKFCKSEDLDFVNLFLNELKSTSRELINRIPIRFSSLIFIYFISSIWENKNFKEIENHISDIKLQSVLPKIDADKVKKWIIKENLSDVFVDCVKNEMARSLGDSSDFFIYSPIKLQFNSVYMRKNNKTAEDRIYIEIVKPSVFMYSLTHMYYYLLKKFLMEIELILSNFQGSSKQKRIKSWLDSENITKVYSLNYIKTFEWYSDNQKFEELIHIDSKQHHKFMDESYFSSNMPFNYNIVRNYEKQKMYESKNYFNNKLMNQYKTIYIIGVNDEPIMLDLIFKHKDKETKVKMSYYKGKDNKDDKDHKIKQRIKEKYKDLILINCKDINWIDN